jgi:hypothetical protein
MMKRSYFRQTISAFVTVFAAMPWLPAPAPVQSPFSLENGHVPSDNTDGTPPAGLRRLRSFGERITF